jgi:hypothetical protein
VSPVKRFASEVELSVVKMAVMVADTRLYVA